MVPKVLVSCDHVRRSTRRRPVPRNCVAYIRRDVLGVRPREKQVSFRHKRTKATQQDLGNHIQLCKVNGISYVPHSSAPRIGNL